MMADDCDGDDDDDDDDHDPTTLMAMHKEGDVVGWVDSVESDKRKKGLK